MKLQTVLRWFTFLIVLGLGLGIIVDGLLNWQSRVRYVAPAPPENQIQNRKLMLASQRIPPCNQTIAWLKEMEMLRKGAA